jgi:hypothetical protein
MPQRSPQALTAPPRLPSPPQAQAAGRTKLLHGCATDLSALRGQWGIEVAGHIDTQVRAGSSAAAPRAQGPAGLLGR